MRINKHDTQGTKPLLSKGELGYDDYAAGGDVGRVYVGTGTENIALAERLESNMMTKAQFNALAEERKANRAGSGFDEWGKHTSNGATLLAVNEGISTFASLSNAFCIGRKVADIQGISKTTYPIANVNGVLHRIDTVGRLDTYFPNTVYLPTAPTIYPHDTVLTTEQINSGVIKHADASNSGLIVNGKFDVDVSGWTNQYPASTIASVGGSLRCTNSTSAYSGVVQAISTVIGKQYVVVLDIVTLSSANVVYGIGITAGDTTNGYGTISSVGKNKNITFTATSTTTYVLFRTGNNTSGNYIELDNIAVYPADAISRSDLVFLESWHEDISEKNFVYPLGNTQYLGGNTDGLTGIANGNFTGFETYSLFGNWQTPSALIGKGYVWSNLTEAQRKAFIANPENNCYLDGDKTIQVRYRVRVVQGWGDSWVSVDNIAGEISGGIQAALRYSSGNNYVTARGKKVSVVAELSTSSDFLNFASPSAGREKGTWSTNSDTFTAGSYNGQCFALPLALVHR